MVQTSPPAPLWAPQCPHQPCKPCQPHGSSPLRLLPSVPPSLWHPGLATSPGANTILPNAPLTPSCCRSLLRGGMLCAQPLDPIPASSTAGRHKAVGSRDSHHCGELCRQPCCSLLHCFFFLIIYIYIKPPWLCCALPTAEEEVVAQGVPWHACEHPVTPSTCWEEGFLAQMFLTCVIWSPQGSRSHGAGT